MTKKKEETIVTMTEEQLERIIKKAIEGAAYDLKKHATLPGNEEDDFKEAPATFSLIGLMSEIFLGLIIAIASLFVYVCGKSIVTKGFNWGIFIFGVAFIFIGVLAVLSLREVINTKKIAIINNIFNAIVGLSSLIVAIIGAYFAYKSIK